MYALIMHFQEQGTVYTKTGAPGVPKQVNCTYHMGGFAGQNGRAEEMRPFKTSAYTSCSRLENSVSYAIVRLH